MFGKASDVSGGKESKLNGKAVKGLVATLCKAFKPATAEDLKDKLGFHAKADVFQSKLPNKAVIYGVGKKGEADYCLLFIDVNGRGDVFYPTVDALWKMPSLLPELVVHAPVSKFVVGKNADVMLPGVVREVEERVAGSCFGIGSVYKGQRRALRARGNPCPFAVGEMLVDKEMIYHGGFRGKGMQVLHRYGDQLWALGGKHKPNEGFLDDHIVATETLADSSDDEDNGDDDEEGQDAWDEGTAQTQASMPPSVPAAEAAEGEQEYGNKDLVEENNAEDNTTEEEEEPLDMNTLVEQTFLQALKRHIKDRELPMLVNQFFSNVLLPCRPKNVVLNLKQTKYKKVGVFMHAMEAKGIISLQDKGNGVEALKDVYREAPELREFKPWPKEQEFQFSSEEDQDAQGSGGNAHGRVIIEERWKLTGNKALKEVLADTQPTKSQQGYLTAKQIRDAVLSYADKHSLEDVTNRRFILLDGTLADALYPAKKRSNGENPPLKLEKGQLADLLMQRMQVGHEITFPDGTRTKFKSGPAPKISVLEEQRQGRKFVTRAWGLEVFGLDAETIARDAQLKFSSSCTTQPRPGNTTAIEVVIQGRVLRDLAAMLAAQHGLHEQKHFQTVDKSGRPK